MKSLLNGVLIITGAVAAAVGVLTGMERLLKTPEQPRRRLPARDETSPMFEGPIKTSEVPFESVVEAVSPAAKKVADRNFSIKRTKSEVGYVYWILEGYGKYKCFVLCDSWDEAVAQAKAKMAEVDGILVGAQSVSLNA